MGLTSQLSQVGLPVPVLWLNNDKSCANRLLYALSLEAVS